MENKLNIQTLICEPFEKLVPKADNMTTEQREIFTIVSGIPEEEMELPPDVFKQLNGVEFKTVTALTTLFTVKYCFRTKLMITILSLTKQIATGGKEEMVINKATALIYLAYVQYKAKQKNVFEVNFRWFCEKLFPEGFVTEHDLLPLFPVLAKCSTADALKSIQWTELDLKLYQEAKSELRQPISKSFGLSIKDAGIKSTPNVMQMLKSNAWINNIKK